MLIMITMFSLLLSLLLLSGARLALRPCRPKPSAVNCDIGQHAVWPMPCYPCALPLAACRTLPAARLSLSRPSFKCCQHMLVLRKLEKLLYIVRGCGEGSKGCRAHDRTHNRMLPWQRQRQQKCGLHLCAGG